MSQTLACPSCGAPLAIAGADATTLCPYCEATVLVPEEMRAVPDVPEGACLPQAKVDEIIQCIQARQKIQAIKVLREETRLSLKEAKDTVESVERLFNSPDGSIPGEAEALLHQVAIVGPGVIPVAGQEAEKASSATIRWLVLAFAILLLVVILALAIR